MAAPAHLRKSRASVPETPGRRSVINLGAEHENLDQKAYQILKAMIMDRQLLPGEKIPQEKLAEDLGISRTPLVNALKFLEKEKLVQSIPRRGFFMRTFTKKEMISIFELREVLEGLAARKAAQKITDNQIVQLGKFFRQFAGAGISMTFAPMRGRTGVSMNFCSTSGPRNSSRACSRPTTSSATAIKWSLRRPGSPPQGDHP